MRNSKHFDVRVVGGTMVIGRSNDETIPLGHINTDRFEEPHYRPQTDDFYYSRQELIDIADAMEAQQDIDGALEDMDNISSRMGGVV